MTELATLARPYAEAVFKRAQESGAAEEWSSNLKFLAIALQNKALASAADNPRVEKTRFADLLVDIGKDHLSTEGNNLVRLLVTNGRLNLIPQIQSIYEEYRALEEGYVQAEVHTAFELSDKDQKQLTTTIEKVLKRKVQFDIKEDSSLIGGVVVRAGDTVIDASVRGQLQKLAKQLYS